MRTGKMTRMLALLAAILLLTGLLAACGSAEPDPNAGMYNAETADMSGLQISIADAYPDGFSIELKNSGKCTITIGTQSASGKWELEGDEITIAGGGVELNGTLKDGTIRTENVMDSGVNINFVRTAD